MWEKPGRTGQVSRKLKAALVALFAIFAISAVGATSANAAPIDMEFNDAWIKVTSLYEVTGPLHAVDPTDGKDLSINVSGDLKADGSFTVNKQDFNFPDQVIDAAPLGEITLSIGAVSDFGGNFDPASGVFSAQLPLSLRIAAPARRTAASHRSTSGSPVRAHSTSLTTRMSRLPPRMRLRSTALVAPVRRSVTGPTSVSKMSWATRRKITPKLRQPTPVKPSSKSSSR